MCWGDILNWLLWRYRRSPNSQQFDSWFFDFTIMVREQSAFSSNCTSNYECWSLPELAIYCTIPSRDAGQRQWATAPSHARDREGKRPILHGVSTVSGASAHLQANAVFRARSRQARLSYDGREVRCIKRIFNLWYFQITMGLLGHNYIVSRGTFVQRWVVRNQEAITAPYPTHQPWSWPPPPTNNTG